ncbi:glycosyltransferase family 1 protein [Enterococcus cecorum]|nr:glycosyltransferase family 1 protein [Enterococcus cecorum]
MKRILEVFGEPISRGGQESYVMSTLQNMNLTGLKVDLFTPYYCDNNEFVDFIESIGGTVTHIDLPFIVGGTRREIIPCFKKYLKGNEYDIVHIHSGSTSVLAHYAKVASTSGVRKVIVHSHSSGVKKNFKHTFIKTYSARLFKKYATDFCASSIEAAEWKFPKKILKKVKILYNGIDLKKFYYDPVIREKVRKKYGISSNDLVLGHVGRFTSEKNQIYLVNLLSDFGKSIKDFKLVLVGNGDELYSVQKKTNELELNDKVLFIGSTDTVNDYMNMFDIFLMPSLYEGLGIVGIEAQATGLPVIASLGVPQIMKVTNNVSFINLDDKEQWIDEILKYSSKKRFDNTSSIISYGFDIKDTAEDVFNMYNF